MKKNNIIKIIVCFCMLCVTAVSYGENFVFKYYHIYTDGEDKMLSKNIQNDSAKVCIDELNQEIELSLFNREVGKWMVHSLTINDKVNLGVKAKIGTFYMCNNHENQLCGVSIVNTEEGKYIDFHKFNVGDKKISCWVKSEKE